jgi:peptide/nickel transport system permease protein
MSVVPPVEPPLGGPPPAEPPLDPTDVELTTTLEDAPVEEQLVAAGLLAEAEPEPLSQWQLFLRRFRRHKLAIGSLVFLVLLYAVVFSAGWLAPFPQGQQDLLLGPTAPSADHWLGTDELGRDLLSELLYAGQISLRIGVAVAVVSTIIGATLGAIAGFYGRWIDQLLMRTTDLFLIVPAVAALAIALRRFGSSPLTVTLVLAGLFWMWIARVVRAQTLALREKEFVEAAQAVGASGPRIIVRHILPNCIGPIMVNATLQIAVAIIAESTLSFLGFGVGKGVTSWGKMLSDAEGYFNNNTHLLYFPGLCIVLTVLAVNALGDGLRDALDPHAKH